MTFAISFIENHKEASKRVYHIFPSLISYNEQFVKLKETNL